MFPVARIAAGLTLAAAVLLFPVTARAHDFSQWTSLLQKYVQPGEKNGITLNLVDYAGLSKDPGLETLLKNLDRVDTDTFANENDRMAFWINVYNILAVNLVVRNEEEDSIKDIGGLLTPVWDKKAGSIGGRPYTLGEIEHKILRPMGDPRIHMAIVCASVSCPDLRQEAYTMKHLEDQLGRQTASFLQNRGKGVRFSEDGREAYVSSIFKWFKKDFDDAGGVRHFIALYLEGDTGHHLRDTKVDIEYMDYDWELNGTW